jgi:hypothetical protein
MKSQAIILEISLVIFRVKDPLLYWLPNSKKEYNTIQDDDKDQMSLLMNLKW